MSRRVIIFLSVFLSMRALLMAQDTPPQTTTPPAPVISSPLILVNEGKPITLPYQCTGEDIRWAGMTCSEDDPCPIYLELSAADGMGNRIFTAGNIHSDTVTLYSVLLGSDDAGQTWTTVTDSYRGSG